MNEILRTIARGTPGRRRAHVFLYPYESYGGPFWTWCREVDGEPLDYVEGLPRCRSWEDAVRGALASVGLSTEGIDRGPVTAQRHPEPHRKLRPSELSYSDPRF